MCSHINKIYLGIIKGLPNIANAYGLKFMTFMIILAFSSMIYAIWKKHAFFSTILTCLVLILVGFSTYSLIFIRATQHPNINENNPDRVTSVSNSDPDVLNSLSN